MIPIARPWTVGLAWSGRPECALRHHTQFIRRSGSRHQRALLHVLVAVLAVSGMLGQAARGAGSVARAAPAWSRGSAPGSGQPPWETFNSDGTGNGTGIYVNVANGNLMLTTSGLDLAGINGLDTVVAPRYNSLSKGVSTDMGHGWILGTGRDVGLLLEPVMHFGGRDA